MKLASHNSWSYLKPKKWWMKLIGFTAKCQDVNIRRQYNEYDVRCFDLRIKFKDTQIVLVHGCIEYEYSLSELYEDLQYLNNKGDCAIRIILDIRDVDKVTDAQIKAFRRQCDFFVHAYNKIKFWCGESIATKEVLYHFNYAPTCTELYSSVCPPKLIDDWYPRIYAILNNNKIIKDIYNTDYLMIDFVNIR